MDNITLLLLVLLIVFFLLLLLLKKIWSNQTFITERDLLTSIISLNSEEKLKLKQYINNVNTSDHLKKEATEILNRIKIENRKLKDLYILFQEDQKAGIIDYDNFKIPNSKNKNNKK